MLLKQKNLLLLFLLQGLLLACGDLSDLLSGGASNPNGPKAVGCQAPDAGIYSAGDSLAFHLAFAEAMSVEGSPRLSFQVGEDLVYANFATGSESQYLSFVYAPEAKHHDGDGIELGSMSIDLNGGKIYSTAKNENANLSIASATGEDGFSLSGIYIGPPSLNQVLWLDAFDSSSMSLTANLVNSWNDKSPLGRHVSASTGQEPKLTSTGGRNAIYFGEGSKYLKGASVLSGAVARSTFVVARPTGLASSVGNAVMGLSSSSVTGRGYGLFMEAVSASTGLALRVGGSKVMGHSLSTVLPNLVSLASPANANVTQTRFWLNKAELVTLKTQSAASLNTENVSGTLVGGFNSSGNAPNASYDFNGYIYEILIYEEFFSDESRQQIENYLSSKWGID